MEVGQEDLIICPPGRVSLRAPDLSQHATRPTLRDCQGLTHRPDRLPAPRRAQKFPWTASFNIKLPEPGQPPDASGGRSPVPALSNDGLGQLPCRRIPCATRIGLFADTEMTSSLDDRLALRYQNFPLSEMADNLLSGVPFPGQRAPLSTSSPNFWIGNVLWG